MVKKNIIDAYVRFREIDNTIPDAVLDFMKDCAIEKIDNINKEKLATETKEKYYTSDHISDQYDKLTQDQKISVLHEAIDIMQQYNGRTRFTCIGMAMGYENYEGEPTTWTKNKKHGK